MKKNYLLSLMLVFLGHFAFGQELLTNGDLELWDDDTTPNGWSKAENIEKESTEKHGGSFSAKHTGGTKDLGQTIMGIVSGQTYRITVWYKVVENDGTDSRIWSYWKNSSNSNVTDAATDGALRGPNNAYFDNNGGQWTEYTADVVAPAGVDRLYFELRTYSGAVTYWDDLSVTCTTCNSSEPSLVITSPAANSIYNPETTSVDVKLAVQNFNVANGTGDGHIRYSLNSGTTMMKYDTNDINLSSLTGGDYNLKVWLVDNSGNPLSPAVEKTVSFSILSYNELSTLAALRAAAEGEYYHITGEVVLTYNTENSRNQKYILDKDGAAGMLIDDNDGVITTSYTVADGITGLKGKLSSYNGVLQFLPTKDPGTATSSTNVIPSQLVTIADLKANPNTYESKPVNIENVTFDIADGTVKFEASKNYDISSGGETLTFRTQFSNVGFIDTVVPSDAQRAIGIASEFAGNGQLLGTKIENMTTASIQENTIEGFSIFPNPISGDTFTLTTASTAKKEVSIYTILGREIQKETFIGSNKAINIANLKTGVYLLKVNENANSATKKLVIK